MKKIGAFIRNHKKICIIIGVIIIAAVVGLIIWNKKKKENEAMLGGFMTETYVLEKRDLTNYVSATGKITSAESKDVVIPEMNTYKILTMDVALGDTVKAGDQICTFDTEEIERNLKYAQDDLAISKKKTANTMDNQSRGLYQTQLSAVNNTNRNLEALDKAHREYDTAAGEKAEASRIYDEVYDVYEDYYDEDKYYDYQEQLQKVKKELESYESKTTSTTADVAEFNAIKDELSAEVNRFHVSVPTPSPDPNVTPTPSVDVYVAVKSIKAGDYLPSTDDMNALGGECVEGYDKLNDTQKENLKEILKKLKAANDNYISAVNATAANLEEYNRLKDREAELNTKITNMSNAKSNLNTAKASVDSAQSKLNGAGDTLQSAERTQQDKYLSDVNGVKDAENNYENTKLDSSVASRTYEDNVRKYEDQLAAAVVKAPFDGVVTSVNGQVGDKYAGGTIVTIEDVSSYVIEAAIDEYDISKIKIGQKVVFKTNATGDEEMEAEVTEIAPRATTATTTNTSGSNTTTATSTAASYKVKMKVTKSNEALRLDMAAKINIITDEVDGVFAVPNSAINTDEDGNDYIEVQDAGAFPDFGTDIPEGEPADVPEIEEAGMPAPMSGDIPSEGRRIYVTVGLQTDYYVEVSSPELTEGMTVILSGGDMDMDDMMGMFGPMGGM